MLECVATILIHGFFAIPEQPTRGILGQAVALGVLLGVAVPV